MYDGTDGDTCRTTPTDYQGVSQGYELTHRTADWHCERQET